MTFLPRNIRSWIAERFRGAFLRPTPKSGLLHNPSRNPPAAKYAGLFSAVANQFAMNFLRNAFRNESSSNQFISPYSIESALMMVLEGAKGRTASELGTALAFPSRLKKTNESSSWPMALIRSDLAALNEQLKLRSLQAEFDRLIEKTRSLEQTKMLDAAINRSLASRSANEIGELAKSLASYELLNANGLWVERTCPFQPEFLSEMLQGYAATVELADFKNDAEGERIKINRWVSDHTQQKINDIVPRNSMTGDTRMVLANAVYFQGAWEHCFEASQTKPGCFYNGGQIQITVPMMSKLSHETRYAAFDADGSTFETPARMPQGDRLGEGYPRSGYQLLELGYQGDEVKMWIALPIERTGLPALIESLRGNTFDLWERALKPRAVQLTLPKFKMEMDYDLRSHLERLGVTAAFDPEMADFSGMSAGRLCISKIIHKASLDVNENGTEAMAATLVLMSPTSAVAQAANAPRFVAEHPFVVMIRHRLSGVPLFIGVVQHLPESMS